MVLAASSLLLVVVPIIIGLVILGRIWRIRWSEIALIAILVILAEFLPYMLGFVSYGRAPLLLQLVPLLLALAWLNHRRNRAGVAGRSTPDASTRSRPEPAVAKAEAPPTRTRPLQPTVFISYRRSDSADITGRIYDRLAQRFGDEHVYKDVDTIPLGVDYRKHLDGLVSKCDALVAVIGREWLTTPGVDARRLSDPRDLVRIEIAAALARGIPVVPVLVGGASIPDERELPEDLRDLSYRNGIQVRPDPDFHKDLDRLIAGLESHFRA
jgi:hypothetical protein